MSTDDQTPEFRDDRHLKPHERAAQTELAFRRIVSERKRAEEAKTERLREARLKRKVDEASAMDTGATRGIIDES